MYDSLYDPYLTSQYHEEYLKLINTFKDLKRPGSFIKYFNINFQQSTRQIDVKSTFDIYSTSDIKFDIYELTPTYNISPIINSTSFVGEKIGNMFDASTTVTIYSIKEPHINDLVVFYDPIKSGEIFRVNNLMTAVNAVYSDPAVIWYEMDLEIAPIKDTGSLKIFKHYVYDIPREKYYNYVDYSMKIKLMEQISGEIQQLNQFYSPTLDLYKSGNYIPMIPNEVVVYFKNKKFSEENFTRVFNSLVKPYGFIDEYPDFAANPEIDFTSNTYRIFNKFTNNFEDYNYDFTKTTELDLLITLTKNVYMSINNVVFS